MTVDTPHERLVLEQFCKVPHIDFGSVHPGASATAILTLHNPTGQVQHVAIDPIPDSTLSLHPMEAEVAPESHQDVCLTWTPIEGSVTGKNFRTAISIRTEGRKRFKAIATGTSIIKSGRNGRKKATRPEATFELTEVDENIIRNGPTSIAWNAEFKKVPSTATTSTKPAVQALGTKRNDNSVPFISPSKIVRYFSKEKSKPEGIVEIDIDDGAGSEKIEIVIEGRKNRHGGVAFDADFTIKLPKAQPLKSKLYQAEVSCSKSVDIRPLARKNSASAFAKKRKALTDISRSVLTPVKAKVKASAFSYREGQFFDEDWAKKQENAFKIWLNFVFKERDTPQAFMIEPHQPAYQSIKEFRAHGQILQKAFFCYHSQPVQNIICAIEQAVSSGQLRIRNDINMLNDVGLRDRFVDLFHSYNSAWLKLGLETVYGEMLPSSSCLRTFIQTRLLSNRQLDSEHTYLKTAQGQPFFDENHKSAMQCFVLKKVLQIVIFLDIAKSQNVFPISPRLFTTNGKIKSTRSLLLEFASTFMAAQGDVVKFIAQISQYECASVQAPLDEFDYQLSDLTADLKDGVRLCALSGEPGIERQILLPAINKSRKKHNVTLALQVFAKSGFPSIQCTADDVVEGNRQRVLILIWNIISHVAIPALLDLPALFNEIRIIRRQNGKTQTCRLYADNNHYQLLLQWCEQICFRFDISIRNFTSSFSDGRGFAAIISFYCPLLIKESDIKRTTRSLQDQLQKKKSGSLSDHAENMGSAAWIHFLHLQASSDEVNEALEGERHNWRLIANAVRQLGAVPFVFSDHGRNLKQSMILEEKSVLIFLSYLCSRLLVLSKESHAARTVQKRWRDIQWRKRTLMIPNASETILVSLMSCYQYCALRKYLTKIRILQSVICTGLTVKQFCVQWNAACVIGSGWRLYRSRKRSRELQISASTMIGPLQSYIYTSFALRMAFFSSMLQNVFRSYSNNKMFSKTKSSVDLLASELRQYLIWRLTCELQGLIISYSRAKSFGSLQASTKMIHGSIQAYLDHNSFQIHLGNVRAAQCGFLTLLLGKQFHQQLEIVRGVQKRWRQVFCRRRQVEFAVDSLSGSLKSCLNFFAAIGWRSQVRLLQGSCLAHLAKTHFRECRASVHVLEERFAQYNRWRSAFTLQTASVAYIQMKSFRIHQFAAATLCESIRSYRHKRDCDKYFSTVNTLEGSIKTYLVCQQLEKIRCSVRLVSSLLCRYRQYWAAGVFQNRWRQITLRRKRRMIQSASCSLSGPLLSYTQNRLFKSYICHLRCIQGSCEALIGLRAINEARSSVRLIISELMRYRKWNAATCLQRRWLRRKKLIRARKIRTSVKALSGPLRSYCRNRSAKQVLGRSQSIQSLFKAYLINNSFQRFSHSVHVIQSYLHRYCEFSAACVLQRTWRERTRRLRERSIRCAIRTLSGPFASCFHAIAFQQYFSKVATIQALVQAHKNTEAFYRIKAAVCVMESQLALYRKFCTTKLIQSQLHCIYAYRRFTMLHASAKSITAALLALVSVRECIARKKYLITIYSIQTTVNTILRHRDFELHRKKQKLNAIAAIQAAICCVQFSSKTAHLIQARHLRSCIKIQRSARQFIQSRSMLREQLKTDSLRILLASFRCILAVRWSQQFRYQVLRVQSLWRGRRQRLMASKKVRQARERILDASSRWALELTIGYRLKQALDVLLSGSKLSDLTQACRMLDHVTRTLPRCCNDAVEHNAVPVLYALMRGLNRSKPHIELLGYAISILATLSQNPAVSEHVFNDESCLDVTLELLQTQRENPDLFIKVAKLLKIGCTDKSFATELRKSAKRIASIHALLSRKLEMGIRYQQPGSAAHSKQLALLDKSVKSIESLQLKLESL